MRGIQGSSLPLAREIAALAAGGLSHAAIAQRYGITRNQVKGLLQTAARNPVKEFDRVHLGNPVTVTGNWVIIGDVHVPCTDYDFAQMIYKVAERYSIRNLCIAGDMFNQDAFSQYADIVLPPSWGDELKAARLLFHEWVNYFDRILVIMGNHDRRLQKWTNAELGADDIFGMVNSSDKITVSNFGYCTIDTNGILWRITHPRNYRMMRLSVANELALKHDCNIISFHEHHLGKSVDKYGRHIIINGGSLVDAGKLAHVKIDDNVSPSMVNGFAIVCDGIGDVFGKYPFTDWGKM